MQSYAKYFTKPFPLSHGQTVKVYHYSSHSSCYKWLNGISKSSCFRNSDFQIFLIVIHSKISFSFCNSGYIYNIP